MQRVAIALGALVLGFALGGVKPRVELREAQQAQALEAPCPERPRARVLPGIGEALPDLSGARARPAPKEDKAPDALTIELGSPEASDPEPAGTSEQFDLAVTAQALRAAQSRQALIEQADLSEEQQQQLDLLLRDMNADLAFYGEDLLTLAMQEEPDPTDALGLTHDVTGVLYESQLALDALVGDAEVDDESRMVWNHLDLEVFRPAVEALEDEGL